MGKEEDLIEAFDNLLHRDFLNPERKGCPSRELLEQFAHRPSDLEFSHLLAHIRNCAACFDELKKLRQGGV